MRPPVRAVGIAVPRYSPNPRVHYRSDRRAGCSPPHPYQGKIGPYFSRNPPGENENGAIFSLKPKRHYQGVTLSV